MSINFISLMKKSAQPIVYLKKSFLLILLIFSGLSSFSQEITVDFEGRVTHDNASLSEVIVQVLQNGKLMTTFKTNHTGNYNIYLPLGNDYLISISKNDYVQKYFSVSTKGIPQEQAGIKFPAIKADVDLLKYYEGVDYSMFNEPITKFYYNKRKDNFDYDKEHLKAKMQAMKLVKEAEKKAIQLAIQKNENKQKELSSNLGVIAQAKREALNDEKKALDEKLAKESLMLKLIEEENKTLFSRNKDEVQLNIVAADKNVAQHIIDKKVNALVSKYKQGVTEERREGDGIIIITRVLVREEEAWVYEKKIFNWGGVAYFRDKQRITASTFHQETAGR
ncbi:MAG: hypothetical protein K0R26_1006 [Bacteroidota bacterium]|jgi:hypothetical protein|nr:hypothetical protein [Bacteroidota bacterium]